jgi:cobalt-zinc-cadmium efflux system outer membrane protein
MRVLVVRAALVGGLLSPASLGAQTLSLTEAQALERMSDESVRVRAARAGIDVARAGELSAGRWPNPRVTYHREAVGGVAEHYVTVAQLLPLAGRRPLAMSAAAAMTDAVSSRADDRVRRLRADLRLAFTGVWAAQARERELTRSRDRLRELADLLARREAGGESAGFDRLRAEREVIDVEADRALAAADRAQAQGLLLSFFAAGDLAAGGVEAVTPERSAAMLPSLDELTMRAETARGDLRALARERDAAAFLERSADRLRIPEPEVVAGTKSSNAGGGDIGGIVSVHLALPLFDRGRPERALARARAGEASASADALRQVVRAEVGAWRATVLERRGIADRYRAAIASDMGDVERIAQVSYENAEGGILDLLDAHRTASAARVRQVLLDAAVREAEIELEFASGWEIR